MFLGVNMFYFNTPVLGKTLGVMMFDRNIPGTMLHLWSKR